MARIQGVPKNKSGLATRLAYWFARRSLGKVPEPLTVVAHHPWLSRGYGFMEFAFQNSRSVDDKLKALASVKVAPSLAARFESISALPLVEQPALPRSNFTTSRLTSGARHSQRWKKMVLEYAALMTCNTGRRPR
jgi:hypothetical protein